MVGLEAGDTKNIALINVNQGSILGSREQALFKTFGKPHFNN